MKHLISAFSVSALLAGCASAPESIGPAYASPMTYRNWTCEQLADEAQRLLGALDVASARQRQAREGDAVGVLLIGLPMASMSGQSVAPDIARLKGEHEALYRVAVERGCQTSTPRPRS